MGGELLRALVAGECPVPITRVRGFRIPHWAGPGTLVMCVSYSGETEETLACARQAHRQGAGLLIVGAGGTLVSLAQEWGVAYAQVPAGVATGQPRAALGYLFGAMAGAFGACGLASEGIASAAAEGVEDVDVAAARELGERLADDDPADLRGGPARRRRLPLEDAAERERQDACLQPCPARARAQRDRRLGGRAARRRSRPCSCPIPARARPCAGASTRPPRWLRPRPRWSRWSRPAAPPPAARAFSLVAHGDWASYAAALARGVDPTPVANIDALKRLNS